MSHEALGVWYCQFVDQEQSEEEADEFGEYDDFGFDRQQKASKTEFAGATLELRDDGRYELKADDYNSSHGTWSSEGGGISLTEADDCTNGYDGLEYAYGDADRFTIGFKLNPDSHDGLDVLILIFGREAPKQKPDGPQSLVDQLIAAEDEDEVYDALDAAFDGAEDPDSVCAELWEAWAAGRLAADPEAENHWLQTQAFGDDRVAEGGGFTHAHARHALESLDYDDDRDMFNTIEDKLAQLAKDDAADAELAPLIASSHEGKWLERIVASRFMGGGLPEELFSRPLMPQPETDEASRAYLARSGYFTRFEAIEKLYPPGHEDLAKILIRYRGSGLLDEPLAMIEARGIADEARAAALAWLEDPKTNVASSTGLSAMLFAVVLSVQAGVELPQVVVDTLGVEIKGMIMGGLSDEEKGRLREIAAKLPEDQRALVHKRFWLDPKA